MLLPSDVDALLLKLETAGFSAYAVGGCVRDSLLGNSPKDWDVCTNARPEQVKAVFADYHTIDTGLRHGTITVRMNHTSYEVTTFRADGSYTDGRRPDTVTFLTDITGDLSRRDFTVNAMAYNPKEGIIDPFGGQTDLQNRVLRTVGDPSQRFREDGLRILRGLRFASKLDFAIEEKTAAAMRTLCGCLSRLPGERLRPEMEGLLTGKGVARVLTQFPGVLGTILPEIPPMVGFLQHSKYHHLDVWGHTVLAVESLGLWQRPLSDGDKAVLGWTLLLHDSGKPEVFFQDPDGVGHFYGHQRMSERIVVRTAQRMRFSNALTEDVKLLVRYHDAGIPTTDKGLRRWLKKLGERRLRLLLLVKQGDALAHAPAFAVPRLDWAAAVEKAMEDLLAQRPCFDRKGLAVTGKDLLALGAPAGKEMGRLLSDMLDAVEAGEIPNEKETLLQKFWKNKQADGQ